MKSPENILNFKERNLQTEGKSSRIKEGVLWSAEKSTYVTVPFSTYLIVTGAISPAVGIGAILIDVGVYKYLKNRREGKGGTPSLKKAEENVIFLNPFFNKRNSETKAA
jgi:hypothetical protein